MTPRVSHRLTVALLGSLLLVATACGSDNKSTAAAASVAPTTTPATTAVATTVAPLAADTTTAPAQTAPAAVTTTAADTEAATDPPAQAGGKVNINEASISDLEAAYKAAGVSNPRRWAQETDEYRPYPTDPGFAKLRQELGKYNIDPAILELLISTLEF